jgi:hypothetical protein
LLIDSRLELKSDAVSSSGHHRRALNVESAGTQWPIEQNTICGVWRIISTRHAPAA